MKKVNYKFKSMGDAISIPVSNFNEMISSINNQDIIIGDRSIEDLAGFYYYWLNSNKESNSISFEDNFRLGITLYSLFTDRFNYLESLNNQAGSRFEILENQVYYVKGDYSEVIC